MDGLPFEQLPADTMTPESTLNEQLSAGRRQIQSKYALQWREVNRSARFLGPARTNQMLQQIDMKAKQEMLQFNQKVQTQLSQLQRITAMGERGLIPDANRIKAHMVFGADVATSMYPEPEEERSVALQFGELDVYRRRIERNLEQFRTVGRWEDKLFARKTWVGYPLPKERKIPELQILDLSLPSGEKDAFGEPIMGKWRKATKEEAQLRKLYLGQRKEIRKREEELLAIPGVGRRVVQPGTTGGSFSDKVAESVRRETPRAPKARVIRQRNRRTGRERISYDGGKTWQIVSG